MSTEPNTQDQKVQRTRDEVTAAWKKANRSQVNCSFVPSHDWLVDFVDNLGIELVQGHPKPGVYYTKKKDLLVVSTDRLSDFPDTLVAEGTVYRVDTSKGNENWEDLEPAAVLTAKDLRNLHQAHEDRAESDGNRVAELEDSVRDLQATVLEQRQLLASKHEVIRDLKTNRKSDADYRVRGYQELANHPFLRECHGQTGTWTENAVRKLDTAQSRERGLVQAVQESQRLVDSLNDQLDKAKKDHNEDERIKVWDELASHPFFKSCFNGGTSLRDAMIAKLDRTWDSGLVEIPSKEALVVAITEGFYRYSGKTSRDSLVDSAQAVLDRLKGDRK